MSQVHQSKKFVTIAIIAVVCLGIYGIRLLTAFGNDGSSGTAGKVKGNENAPIKITEFIDFQCPACADGAKYLKDVMNKHPDEIRLELKHYPLRMHRHGLVSSQYAECALKQGKFWPFHDLLIKRQVNWKKLEDAAPAFRHMAEELGLNTQELDQCLQDETVMFIIDNNQAEGKNRGVRQTPTYFVNGEMIVGRKSLEMELNRLLEEK